MGTTERIESEVRKRTAEMIRFFIHDCPDPLMEIRDRSVMQILDNCEYLKSLPGDGQYWYIEINKIKEECVRIINLVEFLMASYYSLGFLGEEEGFQWEIDKREIGVDEIVAPVRAVLGAKFGGVEFFLNNKCTEEMFRTDRKKLMGILLQLVKNAGKSICDSTEKQRRGKVIIVFEKTKDNCLLIQVIDDGKGLTPDDKRNLHRHGYSRFGSKGLGMSIVTGFLKLAGGQIKWFNNNENDASLCGGTFKFIIPEIALEWVSRVYKNPEKTGKDSK